MDFNQRVGKKFRPIAARSDGAAVLVAQHGDWPAGQRFDQRGGQAEGRPRENGASEPLLGDQFVELTGKIARLRTASNCTPAAENAAASAGRSDSSSAASASSGTGCCRGL